MFSWQEEARTKQTQRARVSGVRHFQKVTPIQTSGGQAYLAVISYFVARTRARSSAIVLFSILMVAGTRMQVDGVPFHSR